MNVQSVGSLAQVLAAAGLQSTQSTQSAQRSGASRPEGPPPAGGGQGQGRVPGHIEVAAEALGLSTEEVTSALEDGSSLAELAEQQGVSRDDLVAALVEGAPDDLQALGDVEEMVGRLVDQQGMGGPQGGPPPGSSGVLGTEMTQSQTQTLSAVAGLLGTSASTLLDSLRSGSSLADLLSNAGVSESDFAGVVEKSLLIDTNA